MIPENLRRGTDLLLESYSRYYDVERCDEDDLFARAEFHSRGEKYLLTRSVNLWSVEDHEYVYFFAGEHLDQESLADARDVSLEEGMSRITPGPDHRSSMITAVLIYNSIDPSCEKAIKSLKEHRDFGLMLRGWMDFRVAAFDASTGRTFSNRAGRDVVRNLGIAARAGENR